jgi:hypothetical protein
MLFVQIVLIDQSGSHAGASALDANIRSVIEGARHDVEPMQRKQCIGHYPDCLGRRKLRGQQVTTRHCAQQQPISLRLVGLIDDVSARDASRGEPAKPHRLVLQLAQGAGRLCLDEDRRLARGFKAKHGGLRAAELTPFQSISVQRLPPYRRELECQFALGLSVA